MFVYKPHNTNNICVIVIPVYKIYENLTEDEKASLAQVVKILGSKYEISIVCPNNLDITGYKNVYDFSFNFADPKFFISRQSYSNLCLDYDFYNSYSFYKYLLIYQLDCWCFSDKLEYFCSLNYDYIGAIHRMKNLEDCENGEVGNGGLSLRKIDSILNVLKGKNYKNQKLLEDRIYTDALKNILNIAPRNIAYTFSIGQFPEIFLQKQDGLPFGCHGYKRNNRWDYWEKYIENYRTLIYTCCDKKYSHFIPLFCAALLYSNTNIDIEIGINTELDNNEEKALKYLEKKYPNSKILIKPNFFKRLDGRFAEVNGIKCWANTVRFITEPVIKDDYIYISDIDIISLEKDFYEQHVRYIHHNNLPYSNKIRLNCPVKKLTGLHFTKYDNYYPINLSKNIDFEKNDEEILYDLCDIKIDSSFQFRPVHGIHMSFNRKDIHGIGRIPGWGAEKYENDWKKFTQSNIYKTVFKYLDSTIKEKILYLEQYYNTRKKVIYTCITNNYDKIINLSTYSDEYDHILFTDDIYINAPEHWIVKKIPDKLLKFSPVKQQRYVKTHPHELLSNYDISIWIDGNMDVLKDPSEIIDDNYIIEVPKHPHRTCVYNEGERCIYLKKDSKDVIEKQLRRYEQEGFPKNFGLPQTNILIRKHNNLQCIKMMEDWWNEIEKGSYRDQLSFSYALWKNKDIQIKFLDKKLYCSEWFNWKREHNKQLEIPEIKNPVSDNKEKPVKIYKAVNYPKAKQTKENTTIKIINKPVTIKSLDTYKLPVKSISRKFM